MFSLSARYRGNSTKRADLVRRSAEALSTLPGVGAFDITGAETLEARIASPEAVCDVVMALLSDRDWAIGISVTPGGEAVGLEKSARAGSVHASVFPGGSTHGADITAVFALLGHVLTKRTLEGREATSLMRSGLSQVEAAERLGISKQAMSQRLQAAGWQAETAGWQLAVNLLQRADEYVSTATL